MRWKEKAGPLRISARSATFLTLALSLAACVGEAPELPQQGQLPPATQQGGQCPAFAARKAQINAELKQLEQQAAAVHRENTVPVFLGGLFILPAAAATSNDPLNQNITRLVQERDQVNAAMQQQGCS